jgi:hypothetical protein
MFRAQSDILLSGKVDKYKGVGRAVFDQWSTQVQDSSRKFGAAVERGAIRANTDSI